MGGGGGVFINLCLSMHLYTLCPCKAYSSTSCQEIQTHTPATAPEHNVHLQSTEIHLCPEILINTPATAPPHTVYLLSV